MEGPARNAVARPELSQRRWRAMVVAAALLFAGCTFGRVAGIERILTSANSDCDLLFVNSCGVLRGKSLDFEVSGEGVCSLARVSFGDGEFIEGNNIDFGKVGATKPWVVSHTYQGWPGLKSATALGVTNCTGTATRTVHVFERMGNGSVSPEAFLLGLAQPTATACTPIPGVPPLRKNTKVSTATANPAARIDFGCSFGGCVHDLDGENPSAAPASFPFPGLRKYSLVLRVGTQVAQGGMNASFTISQSGPLEACVNDEKLTDNTGAWGISVLVDESQAP